VSASSGRGGISWPRPADIRFDEDDFWVTLSDGRVIGVPLAWFPRLLHASRKLVRPLG
jgi:hypothetical protein